MTEMPKNKCLRCGERMDLLGTHKMPLVEGGVAGAEIYVCSGCGKMEFYYSNAFSNVSNNDITDTIADVLQTPCPKCGKVHPENDPQCLVNIIMRSANNKRL